MESAQRVFLNAGSLVRRMSARWDSYPHRALLRGRDVGQIQMEKTFRVSVREIPFEATAVWTPGDKTNWLLESVTVDGGVDDLSEVLSDSVLAVITAEVSRHLREWDSMLYPDPMDAVRAQKEKED